MTRAASPMSRWKKVLLIGAVITLLFVALLALRWHVAQQRVAEVALNARSNTSVANVAPIGNPENSRRSNYSMPEVAGRAAIHLHAIQSYESRNANDLAQLPPAGERPTKERLALLQKLSSQGNARAACSLAQEAAKCVFYPTVFAKELRLQEEQLRELERQGKTEPKRAKDIETSREEMSEFRSACEGFDAAGLEPAWKNMLRSALLGYQPAMAEFVTAPLFDPSDWSASVDAYAAYATYYGPMLDAVAQRGDAFHMSVASLEYGGKPWQLNIFGASHVIGHVTPDPVRALAFAYANVDLHLLRHPILGKSASDDEKVQQQQQQQLARRNRRVSALDSQYSEDHRRLARELANQMVANWTPEMISPPKLRPDRENLSDMLKYFDDVCRE